MKLPKCYEDLCVITEGSIISIFWLLQSSGWPYHGPCPKKLVCMPVHK